MPNPSEPIPLKRLLECAVDDGADYDDGLDGYTSYRFDEETGTLTIWFERSDHYPEQPEDDNWTSAEYRFQLVP